MGDTVKHVIVGVHVTDRTKHVSGVQGIFSEYGCNIRTRIGLHETDNQRCSPNGLILVEMYGNEDDYKGMFDKLRAIEGIEVKVMEFAHA